jgi:transposase
MLARCPNLLTIVIYLALRVIFYLPPYSPERNPDEYLKQDIKAHVRRQRRPHNAAGFKRMVRAYLHQLPQWPEKLSHFFWLPQVQYADI